MYAAGAFGITQKGIDTGLKAAKNVIVESQPAAFP